MSTPLDRLVNWLSEHPLELMEVARRLHMPLPRCQGHNRPCSSMVLKMTPAMTQYSWDGQGEDPNGPIALCHDCAGDYQEYWQEMWKEYYAGVL